MMLPRMPAASPAPNQFALSRGRNWNESISARGITSLPVERAPRGSTTRPRMESASIVTSLRMTARVPRQTCRCVSGGSTPGAGAGMDIQGAQPSNARTAAQVLT
jgi:hypothetical protein